MMLPGVELARKRRIHHHASGGQEAVGSPRAYPPVEQRSGTAMGESALVARRRLEEKLRGFGLGSAAAQSPAFSWRNPLGADRGGGAPRRVAPAASGGSVASDVLPSATRGQKKPPPASAAEPAAAVRRAPAALQRANSAASAEECAVCLEGFRGVELEGRQVLNLPCAHRYHWDCVLPWLADHPNCPCCRNPVVPS